MAKFIKVEKTSLAPTLILLMIGGILGGIFGVGVGAFVSMMAVTFSGPFGWIMFGPAVLAGAATALGWVVIGVPLWALVGGFWFAQNASGKDGSAARNMKVTFFSNTHPITKRVNELADDLGLPPIPHVGWYPSDSINAFAMGTAHQNTLIAVTRAAVEKLSMEQLDAILAHELGHVVNNDMRRMTYARGVQNALCWFLISRRLKKIARWFFTPFSELGILRFSRQREFAADAIAVQLTSSKALCSVLEGLQYSGNVASDGYENIKISGRGLSSIWSTHPSLQDRIKRLGRR